MADYTYKGLSTYISNKTFIEELHVIDFLLPSIGARDFLGDNFNQDLSDQVSDYFQYQGSYQNLTLSATLKTVLESNEARFIYFAESGYYLNHEENLPSNTPTEYKSLSISLKGENIYIYAAVAMKHGSDESIANVQRLFQNLFGNDIQQMATIELMEYQEFSEATPQVIYKKN